MLGITLRFCDGAAYRGGMGGAGGGTAPREHPNEALVAVAQSLLCVRTPGACEERTASWARGSSLR